MGMAEPVIVEKDYPYQGMAEKVHVVKSGHNMGLSFVWPVCDICGAVLADQQRHDEWHEQVDRGPTDERRTICIDATTAELNDDNDGMWGLVDIELPTVKRIVAADLDEAGTPIRWCESPKRTVPQPLGNFTGNHGQHHSPTEGCRIVDAVLVIGGSE